mmetsp:Transcript_12079/g.25567  ORF Transcript_12079/g.25567 Transcript_12079/m.25567 type:complete len:496 (+) Transcript_12079:134-1621(+)
MELFFAFLLLASTYLASNLTSQLLWGYDPARMRSGVLVSDSTGTSTISMIRNGYVSSRSITQQKHPRTSCLHHQQSSCAAPKLGRRMQQSFHDDDRDTTHIIAFNHVQKPSTSGSTKPYPHIDQSMCVAAAEWQNTFKANCNVFHEVDMGDSLNNGRRTADKFFDRTSSSIYNNGDEMHELGSGKWRSAWKLRRSLNNDEYNRPEQAEGIVLKTLNYIDRVHFDHLTFQRNQLDAKISERVSSEYSVEIYGFCGQSALNEVADRTLGAAMKEMWADVVEVGGRYGVDAAREHWFKSFLERLRYARDTARALAYVQSVDAPPGMDRKHVAGSSWNVTIAHNDFRPTNLVLVGNKVKVNDYNAGEAVTYNVTSKSQCRFRRERPLSPYKSSPERAKRRPMTASSDVYALGSILFGLLVGRMPFADLPAEEAFDNVKNGILPEFPIIKKYKKDPAVKTVIRMAKACWAYKESDRPSALEVAVELERAVENLESRGGTV